MSLKARVHGGGTLGRWGNPPVHKISILIRSRLHDRWGDLPHYTPPIWGPPPLCKQVLIPWVTNWKKKKTIINIYITGSVKVKTRVKQDKGGLVSFFLFHCLGTKRVKFGKSLKQQYESTTNDQYFTLNYNRIQYSNTWGSLIILKLKTPGTYWLY